MANSFEEYENESGKNVEPAAITKGESKGYCYEQAQTLPPPGDESPAPPRYEPSPARTNWPILLLAIAVAAIILYLLLRNPNSSSPGNVVIDFSPIKEQLFDIKDAIDKINLNPKIIQPVIPDQSGVKRENEKLKIKITEKNKRISSLEKDVSWLKHLLDKEKRKRVRTFDAEKFRIEEHYKMRKHAISELFRAPWRQGEGDRTLCFSEGYEQPRCYYRDRSGQVIKALP